MKFEIRNSKLEITRFALAKTRRGNSSEAGVTLLLSVLILSGMVLVAVAVSGFTIQEIKSSRAVAVSEPAIIAAETGAEDALWSIKTNGSSSVPNCSGVPSSKNLASSNSLAVYCKTYIGDTVDMVLGQSTIFYLYNPDDPNGDIDLSAYPYTQLTVTNKSAGFQVDVTVVRLSGSNVGSCSGK
jgi:Tfp pilus assembly protein PilX